MSIVLVGSTSGSITLQEPAVAGTTVLDLPAVSGTVITTGSPQSGSVLQVVSAVSTTFTSSTSTSIVTTNITASITPKFATSKVMVFVTWTSQTNAGGSAVYTICRGTVAGTALSTSTIGNPTASNLNANGSMSYLDSPATSSAQTYTLGYTTNGTLCYVSPAGQSGVITLMEIAA